MRPRRTGSIGARCPPAHVTVGSERVTQTRQTAAFEDDQGEERSEDEEGGRGWRMAVGQVRVSTSDPHGVV